MQNTTISQALLSMDGKPLWEYAESHPQNLAAMLACCDKVEDAFNATRFGGRLSPAPFYFRRVAILSRKAKDYEAEIEICNRWVFMATNYASQPRYKAGDMTRVDLSPSSEFVSRAAKAHTLLGSPSRAKRP